MRSYSSVAEVFLLSVSPAVVEVLSSRVSSSSCGVYMERSLVESSSD